MNKTEQNRTEQNRTEQNRTEQNRTEQNRTEQNIDAQIQALCALYNSIVAPFILVETVSHS
jgi:hypothetical protein